MNDNLENAIEKWKGQLAKYEQLFSPAVINSKGFKMERLRQLNVIASRFAHSAKDSSTMRLLKVERQLLERDVKVGFVRKWLNRVIDSFRAKQAEVQQAKNEAIITSEMRSRLQRAGFGNYAEVVSARIRETGKPFTIDHSIQLTPDERADYTLRFRPAEDGTMRFDGYTATLVNKAARVQRTQQYSVVSTGMVSAAAAAALLQGKAIRELKQNGEQNGDWIQYDLTDKDASGNFRTVRYDGMLYERQLKEAITRLPLKDGFDQDKTEELMIKIGEGKDVQVSLSTDKEELPATILPNPRQGNVIVLNKDGKVIDPYRLAAKEQATRPKLQEEQVAKSKATMRVVR